jgi:hypothetical protein
MNERLAGRLAEPLPTFVPLTIYGPVNLALANNPLADGRFSRRYLASGAASGTLDLENPEHLRFFLHGDAMAREWAIAHPGDALRLVLRKWRFMAGALRLGWMQWDWPAGLDGVRPPIDVFVPDSAGALWVRIPLLLIGLVLCAASGGRSRRWAGVALLLTSLCLLTTGLFFGYARQGLLYLPIWETFTAAALVSVGRAIAGRRFSRPALDVDEVPSRWLLTAVAIGALILLATEASGVGSNRNYRASGTSMPGSRKLDPQQPMVLEVLPPAR